MRKRSVIVRITVIMFCVLSIAFSINNFVACKMLESTVSRLTGRDAQAARQAIGGAIGILTITSVILGLVALVILALFLYFILTKPLKQAVNEIHRVARYDLTEGNMELVRAQTRRTDEVGSICRNIVLMQDNLKEIVKDIKSSSETLSVSAGQLADKTAQVKNTSEEINRTMDDMSKGAVTQAQETNEGSREMAKLDSVIVRNLEDAGKLHDNAQEIMNVKNEGLVAIHELIQKTQQSKDSIASVKAAMEQNNQAAQKIETTSQKIKSIANQTNLLSLNASIEAARAGEAGRGFAVVAEEIKSLAEETNTLTNEIGGIIQELLEKTEESTLNMVDMEKIFEQQANSVNETEGKFLEIEQHLSQVEENVNTLYESGSQMMDSKQTLIHMIDNLSSVSEENAACSEEAMASVESQGHVIGDITGMSKKLLEVAELLKEQADKFKN